MPGYEQDRIASLEERLAKIRTATPEQSPAPEQAPESSQSVAAPPETPESSETAAFSFASIELLISVPGWH